MQLRFEEDLTEFLSSVFWDRVGEPDAGSSYVVTPCDHLCIYHVAAFEGNI